MKLRITMTIQDEEMIDDDSDTGLTEDAYIELSDALANYGDNVVIRKA